LISIYSIISNNIFSLEVLKELSTASTLIIWFHISRFSQVIGKIKSLSVIHIFRGFESKYMLIDFKLFVSETVHLKLKVCQIYSFILLSIGFVIEILGGILSLSTTSISLVSSTE
jgi:hypothetical protein